MGQAKVTLERVKGIEPSYEAWEAAVLPLNYTREVAHYGANGSVDDGVRSRMKSIGRAQSSPFSSHHRKTMPDHSATPTLPPEASPESSKTVDRRIRSFVVRAGRMGTGQIKALETLAPRFVVPYQAQPQNWEPVFGRAAPQVLEIGFGMGDATAAIALAQPQTDFVGVEVHPPGVGALLQHIDRQAISNLRIVQHDAVDVLTHMVAPESLAGVHIFFPDPWHKKRHHKRRLIQPPFVALLASRLVSGGYLHCATDWQPYAEQMLSVLSAEPALANTATGGAVAGHPSTGYAPRPEYRPLTKFENRGLKLGHGVWDLIFTKRSGRATEPR
jgi:tRNA (guanine-N7-)-methyltransferase